MIQQRLSFLLAFGIICCGFNVSVAAKTPTLKTKNFIASQDSSIQALDTMETFKLSYDALMKAGYIADQKRDYKTALRYFRQALAMRPNDSWANKAIKNITTYGFDRYMQAGYQADISKDYQAALKHFQKALEIKPNSAYAQKAIANISSYLAVNAQESGTNNQQKQNFDWLWMVVGVAGTLGVSGIILFFLFKSSQSINAEPVVKETPVTNSATETVNSEIADKEIDSEQETIIAPPPQPEPKAPVAASQNASETPTADQSQAIVPANSKVSKLDIVLELITELEVSDRTKRQKTVWELAQRGDSRAMQPLVELMIKVDSQERGLILEAMTQITSRTLKPMNKALMMSLDDDNPRVKQNAIRDLARVYELMNQVTNRLSSVVEDSDEEVQKTAEWALKQLNQMPTVPLWQNHKMTQNNNQDISN